MKLKYTFYIFHLKDQFNIIFTQNWNECYRVTVNIKTLDDILSDYDRKSIVMAINTRRNNAALAAKQKQALEDKAILDKLAQIGCEK